jgi:hypothetical protein
MKVRVRKLENISQSQVPVKIDEFTTIYLAKGEVMENRDIYNLGAIREFVKVEQDLSEIPTINEGKTLLYD